LYLYADLYILLSFFFFYLFSLFINRASSTFSKKNEKASQVSLKYFYINIFATIFATIFAAILQLSDYNNIH